MYLYNITCSSSNKRSILLSGSSTKKFLFIGVIIKYNTIFSIFYFSMTNGIAKGDITMKNEILYSLLL